jgi:threonine dehydratase
MSTARPAATKPSVKKQPVPKKVAPLSVQDYLQKILTSRVYDVAIESPLDEARDLSRRLGHHVWFKREDKQPVFSFKLRGAYNKMAKLTPKALAKGVICASAGNHAQGVAMGAKRLGCQAIIVMPVTTPQVALGATTSRSCCTARAIPTRPCTPRPWSKKRG